MRVRVFKKAQNRVESEDEFDFSQVKLGFWKCEDFASLENFEKCEWVFASLEEKNSLVCFLHPSVASYCWLYLPRNIQLVHNPTDKVTHTPTPAFTSSIMSKQFITECLDQHNKLQILNIISNQHFSLLSFMLF